MQTAKFTVLFLLFICNPVFAESGSLFYSEPFNIEPAGWTLKGAHGEWVPHGGVNDSGALLISGDADKKSSGTWIGPDLHFKPGCVYGVRFKVRSENASGGTVTTGTGFCNVDIGVPGVEWREHSYFFAAPSSPADSLYVKFGLWNCSGDFYLDDLEVFEAEPVYNRADQFMLGDGEAVEGDGYSFLSRFGGVSRNHSRVLTNFTAGFNSQRWCIDSGTYVEYKHELPGLSFSTAAITVNCGYYSNGSAQVLVSADGSDWINLGDISSVGSQTFKVTGNFLPSKTLFVRFEGNKKGCSLQIYNYQFNAVYKGGPFEGVGITHYVEKLRSPGDVDISISEIGFDAPSQRGCIAVLVENPGSKSISRKFSLMCVNRNNACECKFSEKIEIPEGESALLSIPFSLKSTGNWSFNLITDDYESGFDLFVPDYYSCSYGALLPCHNEKLSVWQASSGWKIPRGPNIPLPERKCRGMKMSLAANESESIQVVLTPHTFIKDVRLSLTEFRDGRKILPEGVVEVDRVAYVHVTQPTDRTGVAADWPDPILPQSNDYDLAAWLNQPYWIRVDMPKGIETGVYEGEIIITADGIEEKVKLEIEVYDFELPDRMSCESAFGMNHNRIFTHHRIKDPQDKRIVIDKYLKCLSDNHISPYNPAPLDPWKVTISGLPLWRGGSYDKDNPYKGKFSYRVEDNNEKGNVNAKYAEIIQLTGKPVKVSFAHRSDKAQRTLFTLNFYRKDGSWISGNNRDIWVDSSPGWKHEDILVKSFNKEAVSFEISLWGAGYYEGRSSTGITWFDDIVISEADGSRILFDKGDFESLGDIDNKIAVSFDWTDWDKQMDRAFNEFHFNSYRFAVQGLGGGTFMERYEPAIDGVRESEPAYSILMEKYLSVAERHLKEKGWLEDAYIYWFDEPDPKDYEFVMNGFSKLKRYAPGLRRMLTEQVEPELAGGPNLWCPLTPSLNVSGTEAQRKAGDEFWWYVCCGPKAPYVTLFIDHPGAEMRLWLWQTWAEHVTGILIWETVYWHSGCAYPDSLQNPYEDPMGWVNHVEKGERKPWGNGDGRFMYPPLSVYEKDGPVTDGPVPTIRLEMLRDGLEDYEYFTILKRLLEESRDKLSRRKLEKYRELLNVPDNVSRTLTDFNIDPSAMEQHREKLARAIEDLSR